MSAAPDASAVLGDLVACLAAIGRSMQDAFDPRAPGDGRRISVLTGP